MSEEEIEMEQASKEWLEEEDVMEAFLSWLTTGPGSIRPTSFRSASAMTQVAPPAKE